MQEEIVGVLGFDREREESGGGKIFQIKGEDQIRMGAYCSGQHMTIVRIGE